MKKVDRQIWIDGEFVPWADATVHVLSHSLQRGSLVFDYMSVHDTPRGACVFRLDLHLARFARSCELVGLKLPRDPSELADAVLETVRRNPGATAVKASAYLASLEVDVVAQDDRVTIALAAYDPTEDLLRRNPGKPPRKAPLVRLLIEPERRNRRDDIIPPQAKVSANYASPMTAKVKARAAGYDEIVLVDCPLGYNQGEREGSRLRSLSAAIPRWRFCLAGPCTAGRGPTQSEFRTRSPNGDREGCGQMEHNLWHNGSHQKRGGRHRQLLRHIFRQRWKNNRHRPRVCPDRILAARILRHIL